MDRRKNIHRYLRLRQPFAYRCYQADGVEIGQNAQRDSGAPQQRRQTEIGGAVRVYSEAGHGAEVDRLLHDAEYQLHTAVRAVCESWNAIRARRYREIKHLSDHWSTAVIVQHMAAGNRSNPGGEQTDETGLSLTGVIPRTRMQPNGFRSYEGDIKFGALYRTRDKTYDGETEIYGSVNDFFMSDFGTPSPRYGLADFGPGVSPGDLRSYFNANRNGGNLEIDDKDTLIASALDDYEIGEDVTALYLMSSVDAGNWRVVYGVRYEDTSFDARGQAILVDEINGTGDPELIATSFSQDYDNFLPSINLRYEAGDFVFRAAATQTLARDEDGRGVHRRSWRRPHPPCPECRRRTPKARAPNGYTAAQAACTGHQRRL